MPDIIALRERAMGLIARRREIGRAMARLDDVTLVLTPAMVAHAAPRDPDEDDEEDGERLLGKEGEGYPLLSSQALLAIIGHGDLTDDDARLFQGNTVHDAAALRRAASDLPEVEAGPEPDLASLTRFEVVALVEAYKSVIRSSAEALHEARDAVVGILGQRSRLPGYVRAACLGTTTGPDGVGSPHRYDESDFKDYNRREEPIRPFEKGYVEGRGLTRSVDGRPQVFSARYLATVLGDEAADRVEAALAEIHAATAPRPGDPDPRPRWPSWQGAPVEVAFSPEEVGVDEDHGRGAGPRP